VIKLGDDLPIGLSSGDLAKQAAFGVFFDIGLDAHRSDCEKTLKDG